MVAVLIALLSSGFWGGAAVATARRALERAAADRRLGVFLGEHLEPLHLIGITAALCGCALLALA